MPRTIACAITTVRRTVDYVHGTVRGVQESGIFDHPGCPPVRLVVGSSDSSYLDRYARDPRFAIERLTDNEALECRAVASAEQRIAFNVVRSLERHRGTEFLLQCEDDLRFASRWLPRLNEIVDGLEKAFSRTWILTLYLPSQAPFQAHASGKKWCAVNWHEFFGTLAVLYPTPLAHRFAAYLREKCLSRYIAPPDFLLGAFAHDHEVPFLATAPCLVQHVGRVSTFSDPSHKFYRTSSFSSSV